MRNIFFPKRRYRQSYRRFTPSFAVSEGARKTIIILTLVMAGLLTGLAWLEAAGVLGSFILTGLTYLLGKNLVLLFMAAVWTLAILMSFPEKFNLNAANYLGLILFIVGLTGLFHLAIPFTDSLSAAKAGEGGGLLGLLLGYGVVKFAGLQVAVSSSIFFMVISISLIFDTSLAEIGRGLSWLMKPFLMLTTGVRRLLVIAKEKLSSINLQNFKDLNDAEEVNDDEIIDDFSVTEEEEVDDSPNLSIRKLTWGGLAGKVNAGKETVQPLLPQLKFKKRKMDMPLDLLDSDMGKPSSGDIKVEQKIIQETLRSFNIDCEMGDVTVGPTITRYTLKPANGVRLSKINALHNDLALALAAHPIRIEAPIPGQSLVGIEVPNKKVAVVKLREVLASKEFKKRDSSLMIALGKDVTGKSWVENLESMPHLLVAGATNSGKSVCLNTIIMSLIYQNHPDDLQFILVDPKRVEFSNYGKIPHLRTSVITDVPKVINALKWSLREMDRRYQLLQSIGKRNLADYNASPKAPESLPHIVIVIDELADLMTVASSDVEAAVIRLSQMARAVGIHLIVATQRPSVDVITGLIKANIPTRIAFVVASSGDSRTIIDSNGAEKLLGRGDMLFVSPKLSKPQRIQGAAINDMEIERVVNYLNEHYKGNLDESITERQTRDPKSGNDFGGGESGLDLDLIEDAIELVRKHQKASATFFQRYLHVGYARAANILDELEARGVVGPAQGGKAREVLLPRVTDDNMEEETDDKNNL